MKNETATVIELETGIDLMREIKNVDDEPIHLQATVDDLMEALMRFGVAPQNADRICAMAGQVREVDRIAKEGTLTLQRVLKNACQAPDPDASLSVITDRVLLGIKIAQSTKIEFKESEREDLKKAVHRAYKNQPSYVTAMVCLMLDGKL